MKSDLNLYLTKILDNLYNLLGYEDFETCRHGTFVDNTHFVSVKLTYLKHFGFNFKVQIFLEGQKNLKKKSPTLTVNLKNSLETPLPKK